VEYCENSVDDADDKKKGLERAVGKLEKSIDVAKETIATLTDEIAALEAGIVALDKSGAEATANRKEENSDYTTLMASHSFHGQGDSCIRQEPLEQVLQPKTVQGTSKA